MSRLNPFRWEGSGKVYSLPWLKNRLEYSSDPKKIAEYTKTPFTRSRLVMSMLTEYHLSRSSIVVSDDSHAMWLRRLALSHMPMDKAIPQIAKDLMERVFPPPAGQGEQTFNLFDRLIRELYLTMLDNVLQVTVQKPLEDYIARTKFSREGSRRMVLEGVMYSLWLHSPLMRPVRYLLDSLFFKKALHMKRTSVKLEQLVCDHSVPKPGSWFSTLADLRASGKITEAQFKGEITSMLVSSFSLSSALGSALLCLAARPRYQKKIHDDPAFARYFVMEVLRLYPPFRQFGYEHVRADADPSGSSADAFMIPVFELHRRSDAWKDPKKFYPERFLDPDAVRGFKYMPFGMGKRVCIGRSFSMSMLAHTVRFACSDESSFVLVKRDRLPRGGGGRLISFAFDDSITYRAR